MKSIKNLVLIAFVFSLFISLNVFSQEEEEKEEFEPVFLTLTTIHRSSDPDVDFSDWKEVEQEYHDNVIMKNDLIIGSGVYFHYFTPDDSEMVLVSVYKSWADIETAGERNGELVREHWPDEEARTAYFEKKNSYYSGDHSDEIMVSTPYQIAVNSESTEPLIFYVKSNKRGDGGGSGFSEYFENVTKKNKYLKGYYTHVHRYGSDSNQANEVFVFENLGDIELAFEEDNRLIEEHWPDEEARKEFFKGYNKIFVGHGDSMYTNVPSLVK